MVNAQCGHGRVARETGARLSPRGGIRGGAPRRRAGSRRRSITYFMQRDPGSLQHSFARWVYHQSATAPLKKLRAQPLLKADES